MAETCGCSHHTVAPPDAASTVSAEQTVGEVGARSPRALEVLKAKGINHCCGAHLTLREAAASAGQPLEGLLLALRQALAPGGVAGR